MTGKIAYEHWHRYAICLDHSQGAEVLDVASGEGYGSAFLAETASQVVGLEIDEATVERARSRYHAVQNLRFETGDCRKLPFDNASFDIVVSMETFEHIVEQQQFIAEIKRVLRPHGLFIVSTPNRAVYNEVSGQNNPFHKHEVNGPEFIAMLSPYFAGVELLGQRLYIDSIIGPINQGRPPSNDPHYSALTGSQDRLGYLRIAAAPINIESPEYFVAFCSDVRVDWPVQRHSIYINEADDLWREKEKILRWASGLHRETEGLRQDFAALLADSEAARVERDALQASLTQRDGRIEQLTVELGAGQAALARNEEALPTFLPLIEGAAQRVGLDLSGQSQLVDVVRVLVATDRACEIAVERQAASEAREALLRRMVDDLRAIGDRMARDIERSREEAATERAMRDESARRLDNLHSEIGRLREDSVRRDADLREVRAQLSAAGREVEVARADGLAAKTREMAQEAALAFEQDERQRHVTKLAEIEDELRSARERVAVSERHNVDMSGEVETFRRLVQDLEQQRAAAQETEEVSTLQRESAGSAISVVGADRQGREAVLRRLLQQEVRARRRIEALLHRRSVGARRLHDQASRLKDDADRLRGEFGAARHVEMDFIHAEFAGLLAGAPTARSPSERNQTDGPAKIATRALKMAAQGDAARDARDYRRAAQRYGEALRLAPDWTAIWIQSGHMLKEQGDHAGSETAYLRAIALAPGDGDAHRQLGHVRKVSGRLNGALEAYARAAELDPGLADIQRELETTAMQAETSDFSPQDRALLDEARGARDRGEHWATIDALGRILRRAPSASTIWLDYGRALRDGGHGTMALRAFGKAIGLRPMLAEGWSELGKTLVGLGDQAGARIAIRRAVELEPASQNLQARMATVSDGEQELSLAHAPVAEFGGIEWTEHGEDACGDWPILDPAYWLPQRLRDLLVDRYGEEDMPRFSYLMGIVDRFADRPSDFRPETDGRHLIETISRAAKRNDQTDVRASIIIPVYDNLIYTLTCIASILDDASDVSFEIIVGDDGSGDATFDVLSGIGGCVRVVRHDSNLGFLLNCNATAATARGAFIVLLNNDTIVLPGWLDALIGTFDLYPNAGFVGSKLLNGDGSLQEAGGIFWKDGSAWNFGRNSDSRSPEFNYVKDVDYVSGASIALPTGVWKDLGGFDPIYSPAYCEDSDIAFRVRDLGLRTLYQPRSVLIHHEGRSHGQDLSSGIKAYQVINEQKLYKRWKSVLERDHFSNAEHVFVARDRSRRKPHLVLIDHYIPQWDRDAGSRTIYLYLKLFSERGFQITFWPDNLHEDREYITGLQDLGVEVIYSGEYVGRFSAWLQENKNWIDYAFVSRPHIAQHYMSPLREAGTKVLYYGHDLHFRRTMKEYDVTRDDALLARARDEQSLEEKVWRDCDVILYPSVSECDEVRRLMPSAKAIVPFPITFFSDALLNATQVKLAEPVRSEGRHLVFVGGFSHTPNVDAMLWFVAKVMPLLRRQGGYVLSIAGSNAPDSIRDLAAADIRVLGRISDAELDDLYARADLAVLPLRYGAGVKGKLVEAFAKGVPVVSTSVGIQGVDEPERVAFVADQPSAFAQQILRAATDRGEAIARARAGLDFIWCNYSENSAVDVLAPHMPELRT